MCCHDSDSCGQITCRHLLVTDTISSLWHLGVEAFGREQISSDVEYCQDGVKGTLQHLSDHRLYMFIQLRQHGRKYSSYQHIKEHFILQFVTNTQEQHIWRYMVFICQTNVEQYKVQVRRHVQCKHFFLAVGLHALCY